MPRTVVRTMLFAGNLSGNQSDGNRLFGGYQNGYLRLDTKFYIALAQVDIAAHPMLAVSWRIFHNAEM